MMDIALDDLMKDVAKGDQVAFRTLARALGPRLFSAAYRLMGQDKMAAEDAVQETLIKLWTGAPRYVPQGTLYAYAATILHRVCMDLYRKGQKATAPLDDDIPSGQSSALDGLEAKKESALLGCHIAALPARQQQAIFLSYYTQESNKDIAKILHTSEKAVESLLVRARRSLARTLPQEMRPNSQEKGEIK